MNYNNLNMHFKGYEEFVSRVMDLKQQAIHSQRIIYTPFLNEHEQDIVHKLAHDCFLYEFGGYENAERKRIGISCNEEDYTYAPIVCLRTKYNKHFDAVNHRDVLGALMHMGIERKCIGDIIVDDSYIYCIVNDEISDYVMQQLNTIKRCHITFEIYEEPIVYERKIEWEQKVISSMRLDCVVACMIKSNREKAKAFIKSGNIKVNQVILEENSHLCNNNDVISIRGYGRFVVRELERKTKKNRMVVEIGKYI